MSVSFSFKLSDDFVEGFRSKKAPFGFRDAAGPREDRFAKITKRIRGGS